jgi:hypothetical protein
MIGLGGGMSHTQLDSAVQDLVVELALYAHHDHDPRGTGGRGWPDWVIIGPRGVLWREIKPEGAELSSGQRRLGYLLQASGQDWAVWGPGDLAGGLARKQLEAIQ